MKCFFYLGFAPTSPADWETTLLPPLVVVAMQFRRSSVHQELSRGQLRFFILPNLTLIYRLMITSVRQNCFFFPILR